VSKINHEIFIKKYEKDLQNYWNSIEHSLLLLKSRYEWPKGTKLIEAINRRNEHEAAINKDLKKLGYLKKQTFDSIMQWGFRRPSNNTELEIMRATQEAFLHLRCDRLKAAAISLIKLDGIGISRASKVLALSNQSDLGIYDSRAAHGLSDFGVTHQKPLIPVPPGRKIQGSLGVSPSVLCDAFENYNWILRYFRKLARKNPELSASFARVADIEMAIFARSRAGFLDGYTISKKSSVYLGNDSENNSYKTL